MPTYAYECKSCQHAFEVQQSFSDSALTDCPACKGPLKKVFGNLGVTFKGSGFYRTDNASQKNSGGAKSDS
jgi:putative FmdB family regulatory protein